MRPLKNTSDAIVALEAHEHMKTRVITAAILVPLLLIVLLFLPKFITAILFGLLAAVAVYELLMGTGYIKQFRLAAYGMVTDGAAKGGGDRQESGFEDRPLGQGLQDVKAILEACEECGTEYVIVEQDDPSLGMSELECAKASRDYLRDTFGI